MGYRGVLTQANLGETRHQPCDETMIFDLMVLGAWKDGWQAITQAANLKLLSLERSPCMVQRPFIDTAEIMYLGLHPCAQKAEALAG